MVPEISGWKLSCGVRECWGNLQGVTGKHHRWWAELDGTSLWMRVGLGLSRWLWGDPRLPVQSSAQTPRFVSFKFRHLITALEGGNEFSVTSSLRSSRVQACIWSWLYPAFVLPQGESLPQKKVLSRETTAMVEQVPWGSALQMAEGLRWMCFQVAPLPQSLGGRQKLEPGRGRRSNYWKYS